MASKSLALLPSDLEGGLSEPLQNRIDEAIGEFSQRQPIIDVFVAEVWPILEAEYGNMVGDISDFCNKQLNNEGISCTTKTRTKSIESIRTTLERHQRKLSDTKEEPLRGLQDIFDKVRDLAAIQIVVDYRSDIGNVTAFIHKTFKARQAPRYFSPPLKNRDIWKPLFGAYETCNHYVEIKRDMISPLSKYCGVMFEIQLTDIAESLYNRFAHPLLYKKSSGEPSWQDEIVVDMSHGISLLYSLCLVYMEDRFKGRDSETIIDAMKQAEANEDLDVLAEATPRRLGSDTNDPTLPGGKPSLKRPAPFSEIISMKALKRTLDNSINDTHFTDSLQGLVSQRRDADGAYQGCGSEAVKLTSQKYQNIDIQQHASNPLSTNTPDLAAQATDKSIFAISGPSYISPIGQLDDHITDLGYDDEPDYQHLTPLGSGAFAAVDKVKQRTTGRIFARKSFHENKGIDHAETSFLKEVRALKILRSDNCENVVKLFDAYTCKARSQFCLIITPVANEGNLMTRLERYFNDSSSIDEDIAAFFTRTLVGLASGLSFLHDHKIRHKDICPENILIHYGKVIFTDFGVSGDWCKDISSTTASSYAVRHNHYLYAAPELLLDKPEPRNDRSDVFSVGCIYFDIIAIMTNPNELRSYTIWGGGGGYGHKNNIEQLQIVRRYAREAGGLCATMLQRVRDDRPNASRVLQLVQRFTVMSRIWETGCTNDNLCQD